MGHIDEAVDIIVRSNYDYYQQYDEEYNNLTMTELELSKFNYRSNRQLYGVHREDVGFLTNKFKVENVCLLPTFNSSHMMYLCHNAQYDRKVMEHFKITNAYTMITDLHQPDNDQYLKDYLDIVIDQIEKQLIHLLNSQAITMEHYQQMIIDQHYSVEFNSISFLPDTRFEMVPFRPCINDVCGPTTRIAKYLHSLIYPFYYLAAQSTTFNTGSEVVQEFEKYKNNDLLQSITQFVMIDMKDFESTFDHKQVMITFDRFLHDHVDKQKINGLSFSTILSLVRLILRMQYFIYDNKLYQQTKGGGIDLPITKLLLNIYLFYWQQDLTKVLYSKREIFGRNSTQLFFTWNASKRRLVTLLTMIKSKQHHLSMNFFIGTSIRFLDVEITHNDSILRTKPYRSCLSQSYTLSYTTNKPSKYYFHIIRTLLIQAISCCINIHDFFKEFEFMYSICLFNRFPLGFIDTCTSEFFNEFNTSKVDYEDNQHTYEKLRQQIIGSDRCLVLSTNNKRRQYDIHLNNDLDYQINRKRMKTCVQ
ncbi:unnamed protein product [Adineta steineri]|uniref:Uncharacterized protein n=1 Tax=Adineta steineri TaxID=433720 RepID=A0A818MCH7_9BILA|nr:unnamed protein product [Adineta steineri]CAF3586831.1 unnamed protein product [Adineta steineri]